MKSLEQLIKEKVLVLDGSIDSYLKKYNLRSYDFHKDRFSNLSPRLDNYFEILSLTKPEIVKETHERYLKAGADIISTNTCRANGYYLEQKGISDIAYELNFNAAKLAREVATKYSLIQRNKPRFVAGVIGPIPEKLEFEQYRAFYSQSIRGLLAGKVDIILFQTFISEENLLAALEELNSIMERRHKIQPIIISATITDEQDKLMITPQLIEKINASYSNLKLIAVGENCGLGPEEVYKNIKLLAQQVDLPIIAFPNVGLGYDEPYNAAQFATVIKRMLDEQLVNIVGGCCGTTPEYIELIAKLAKEAKPRPIS